MKGQGLNDLPHCELERRSSHHKGIFFEVPNTRISPTMAEAPVATSISAAPDTVNLPIYLNKEVPLALHCRPFI